jgi:predicted ATPase
MITLIETLNFRSLRYISQPLGSFHILVGPNASGKTTFLDVISFINQLVSNGLESAINDRARNFHDLLWQGHGNRFELAIEAKIPDEIAGNLSSQTKPYDTIRYEIAIGIERDIDEVSILEEKVLLKTSRSIEPMQRTLFPMSSEGTATLISKGLRNSQTIVNKVRKGNDYFRTEFSQEQGKSWQYAFKLGLQKSALGNLPADETQFPATTWLKNLLTDGVQPFVLNSLLIRKASPPGQKRGFKPDGSNLPWVIDELGKKSPKKFKEWISHLQTALPDIENIITIEREDDRHRYLVIKYKSGIEVPSWVASDGTLRLLALTLPAYLTDLKGIYLIEEPENGIHPRAVETIYQSLASVYDAQILMATHSPVILGIADAKDILCFAKTSEGATDIVSGNLHPALAQWQGETNLGVLFAAGVLG